MLQPETGVERKLTGGGLFDLARINERRDMKIRERRKIKYFNKATAKFSIQFDYAIKVLYSTFADTLDEQLGKDNPDLELAKFLLLRAVYEVLGYGIDDISGYSPNDQKKINGNRDKIEDFKQEMMDSKEDIREYIVQTVRLCYLLNGMTLENYMGSKDAANLEKILTKYGAGFSHINPELYEEICIHVAQKTNSLDEYKSMLSGKSKLTKE